jgi:hypothetical protein
MSRTIKAIERHLMLPVRPDSNGEADSSGGELALLQIGERKLVAEWQRGVEVLGHAQRKLRLAFAPAQSPAVATLSH